MVMEMMADSLTSFVDKHQKIPVHIKFSIVHDVSLGLCYIHNHDPPIVHRDLSPNNIMLTAHHVAKISDLGVAKVVKADSRKTMTKAPGTVDFMPPESLANSPVYGPSMDVFSFGGIILHTFNQQWPRPSEPTQLNSKTGRVVGLSEVERRQQYLDKMTGEAEVLRPLVEECLEYDHAMRPAIAVVCERIRATKDAYMKESPQDYISLYQQVEQLQQQCREKQREIDQLRTAKVEQMFSTRSVPIARRATLGEGSTAKSKPHQLILKESTTPGDLSSRPPKISWERGAPLPVKRARGTAVWLDGLVYVGGGYETGEEPSYRIDRYSPANNSWSPHIVTPYSYFAMSIMNSKLIIAGGKDRSNKTTKQIIMIEDDQLKNYTKMSTARSWATAAGHHGILIITGGVDDKGRKLSSSELYNSTGRKWHTCDKLPQPQWGLQPAVNNNTLYLLGGYNQDGCSSPAVFTASLDTLSRHQLKWNTQQDIPWHHSTPVSVHDTHLLIMGGVKMIGKVPAYSSEVYKVNHVSHSWEFIGRLPLARQAPAAVSTADSRVIVMGGYDHKGLLTNTTWIGSV